MRSDSGRHSCTCCLAATAAIVAAASSERSAGKHYFLMMALLQNAIVTETNFTPRFLGVQARL